MKRYTLQKGVVASALALAIVAGGTPTALAQSPSTIDLQAQIAQLLAQISALQAKISGTSGAPSTCVAQWTRPLGPGSTGSDVQKLQQFLNSDPDTRIAISGAGSPGAETMFYGPATAAAVSKFQVKYRSDILTPSSLVNPTGFFGPSSLAKANALCATSPTTPTTPSNPSTPSSPDDTTTLRGEGTLDTFELDEAPTSDIKEAAGDAVIGEITLEAKNGDIELSRIDLRLTADSGNTERDPWDTFENISLWVDGEKIAEKRIDDRSLFLNRTNGSVRLTGLDLVVEEGEEVEMQVAVSVQNRISGAGTAADWSLKIDNVRYFDGDGVATTDTNTGDIGNSVDFSIVERGDGEELKFSLAPNNPEAATIVVDDSRRTSNITILEYTIEALDADIELDTLYVNVETGTAAFENVVHDVRLVIDNQTFRKDAVVTTGSYTATSTRVAFDIDGDITIDADEQVRVRVVVDLKPRIAYNNNETITARITSAERDITEAEGSDDIDTFSGSAVGKTHTLVSEGAVALNDSVSFKTSTLGQNSTVGVFTIEFDVMAVEEDFYITDYASTTAGTTTGGVRFTVDSPAGDPETIVASLSSNAREEAPGVFTVREGETRTFTLTVTIDAAAAGTYRVGVDSIFFSEETDGTTNSRGYLTIPTNKFRTPYQFINN